MPPSGACAAAGAATRTTHSALATPGLPVDWFDAAGARWRPTLVVDADHGQVGLLSPHADHAATRTTALANVRCSQVLSDALARFWLSRARLRLLLSLGEHAPEGGSLRREVSEEREAVATLHPLWAIAYREGVSGEVDLPHAPLPAAAREHVLPPLPHPLRRRAADMLGTELLRLHGALLDSGVDAAGAARHPVVAGLAALFSQAADPEPGDGGQARATRPSPGWSRGWTAASPRLLSLSRSHS